MLTVEQLLDFEANSGTSWFVTESRQTSCTCLANKCAAKCHLLLLLTATCILPESHNSSGSLVPTVSDPLSLLARLANLTRSAVSESFFAKQPKDR